MIQMQAGDEMILSHPITLAKEKEINDCAAPVFSFLSLRIPMSYRDLPEFHKGYLVRLELDVMIGSLAVGQVLFFDILSRRIWHPDLHSDRCRRGPTFNSDFLKITT